jgi:mannose-6-phosphate isomerase-like protein (cupin superfamily)
MFEKAKPEFWTDERCYIAEFVNDPAWPEFSLARCRVEPGVTTQRHALSVHEVYLIREGTGMMYVGGDPPFEVGPGDSVTIPKHVAQRITNTGDGDLVFDCLCSPRFKPDSYTSLE